MSRYTIFGNSGMQVFHDGKLLGSISDITVNAKVDEEFGKNGNISFDYNKSVNLTLTNVEIRKPEIVKELLHLQEILKYVNHSKKREKALRKYRELIKILYGL